MSNTSLSILIQARDAASSVMNNVTASGKRLDSTLSSTTKTTSRLGSFFKSTAGKLAGLVGGALAARAAFNFGADALKSAEDAKRSMAAFTASLERTGQVADINADKFNDWLQTMGESIGQDDEDLRDLATSLTSAFDFSKLEGDATKNLMLMTQSIQDVSAATGKSAGLIKRMFITLANDPEEAITQFQKLGVITEDQADHFTAMAQKGKGVAVTQELLTLTSKRYKGAAAANTTVSAKLSTIWGNMKESLGNFLLPLFEKGVKLLSRLVSWFRDAVSAAQSSAGAFRGVSAVFGVLVDAGMRVFALFRDDLLNVWNALVDVYKRSLAPALQSLFNALKALQPILKAVAIIWAVLNVAVLKVAVKALPTIIKVLGFVIKVLAKVIEWVAKFVASVVTGIAKAVMAYTQFYRGVINWVGKAVSWVLDKWNKVVDFFRGLGARLANAGRGMWNWLADGIKAAVNSVIGWLNTAIDLINKFQVHIHLDPPGPGSIHFDWNGPNIPHIPTLAHGGITTGPTLALIGDNPGGREAIIPLPPNWRSPNRGVNIFIDRRRWVEQSDYEVSYRGY